LAARLQPAELDLAATHDVTTGLLLTEELHPRDNSYLRLSGLYQCKRRIAYTIKWHQEGRKGIPNNAHTQGIFDVGHAMHYHLQMRLSKHGSIGWVDADPVVQEDEHGRKSLGWAGNFEVSLINHEYRTRGTLDCLTEPLQLVTRERNGEWFDTYEVDPKGKRLIIDIKTCSARNTWKPDKKTGELVRRPSGFEKLTEPKPEHITQAMMYAWQVTQPGFQTDRIDGPLPEMPDVMILYVAKDVPPDYYGRYPDQYPASESFLHSPYKVFRIPADQFRVNTALRKVNAVWEKLDAGELPSRDYHHTLQWPAYECVDCPFRKTCYAEEGYFQNDSDTLPARAQYAQERIRSGEHFRVLNNEHRLIA
jgi:hypothetical protein